MKKTIESRKKKTIYLFQNYLQKKIYDRYQRNQLQAPVLRHTYTVSGAVNCVCRRPIISS